MVSKAAKKSSRKAMISRINRKAKVTPSRFQEGDKAPIPLNRLARRIALKQLKKQVGSDV